jgi:hypothetical protein
MLCLPGEDHTEQQNKRQSIVDYYRLTIQKLQQNEDFTEQKIDDFQTVADKFFKEWIRSG